MKRLHKAAAALFAAAILCSFSVFAYAAEDDWGDEWETEEISAAEVQESSQQSSQSEDSSKADTSVTTSTANTANTASTAVQYTAAEENSAARTDAEAVQTGDNSSAGIVAISGAAAASAAIVGVTVRRRKKTI